MAGAGLFTNVPCGRTNNKRRAVMPAAGGLPKTKKPARRSTPGSPQYDIRYTKYDNNRKSALEIPKSLRPCGGGLTLLFREEGRSRNNHRWLACQVQCRRGIRQGVPYGLWGKGKKEKKCIRGTGSRGAGEQEIRRGSFETSAMLRTCFRLPIPLGINPDFRFPILKGALWRDSSNKITVL